jgi:molybdenum cofactor cytidylyltransferase
MAPHARRVDRLMPEADVVALVLAAGASTRLGRPKQLELLRGRPLVAYAALAAGEADKAWLVTGHRGEDVARAAPQVPRLHVTTWYRGLGHVLATAVARLADPGAVVVLLADQPNVTPQAVRAVIEAWRGGAGPVVTAQYGARAGHPRLFDRSLLPQLSQLEGDQGAHSLLRPDHLVSIPVIGNDDDVDDEADLRRARGEEPGTVYLR